MSELDLSAFKDALADVESHAHPSGYDLYCHNLQSWMGERARLLVDEIEGLRSLRDQVLDLCYWEDHDEREHVLVDEIFEVLLGRWTPQELDDAVTRAKARYERLKALTDLPTVTEDPAGEADLVRIAERLRAL